VKCPSKARDCRGSRRNKRFLLRFVFKHFLYKYQISILFFWKKSFANYLYIFSIYNRSQRFIRPNLQVKTQPYILWSSAGATAHNEQAGLWLCGLD
jgi:hypothetical protein